MYSCVVFSQPSITWTTRANHKRNVHKSRVYKINNGNIWKWHQYNFKVKIYRYSKIVQQKLFNNICKFDNSCWTWQFCPKTLFHQQVMSWAKRTLEAEDEKVQLACVVQTLTLRDALCTNKFTNRTSCGRHSTTPEYNM